MELERRKFDFEVMKWEEEKTQRAADIKRQDERDRLDMIHREQTLQFQMDSLQRQRDEINRRDSTVSRIKVWGDAMRNAALRMGQDLMDLPPFFDHVERLFGDLKVPKN